MKQCPYCWEQIQNEAKKCRHCWEWLEETVQSIWLKKNDDQTEKLRNNLTEKQKGIVRKATYTYRIIWILLPWIFLLRARSYRTLVLLIFASSMVKQMGQEMGNGVWWILLLLLRILSSIRFFTEWSKWAFDNSKWYLKWLVH